MNWGFQLCCFFLGEKDADSWFSAWAGIKNDAVQSLSPCAFTLQAEGKTKWSYGL